MRTSRISPAFLRVLNPLLIVGIATASFLLLGAYFAETDRFIYSSDAQRALDNLLALGFLLATFALYFAIGLAYERPVHRALSALRRDETPPETLLALARLRAMNAPLVYASFTAVAWLFSMMFFPFVLSMACPPVLRSYWLTGILIGFFIGAFLLFLIYFAVSLVSRSFFLPALFPLGHLDSQAGGHSLSVRARLHLVFLAICVLPLLLNLVNTIIWRRVILEEAPQALTAEGMAEYAVSQSAYLSFFSFCMGLAIIVCFGLEMRKGLRAITGAVEAVHRGDLGRHVAVTSRDEIGLLGDRVNEMIIGLRERKRIIEAFNRYVDRTLTKQVLAGDLSMGGIQLEVSIIFSDIRGYTALSEGMEPARMVAMLNRYFTLMASAIEESGGAVNKFIGDAILAVFGAPEPRTDHRDRALRAALAMHRALGAFNAEQREDGLPELCIGIGIHSGLVLAGNIGTANKIEYTVIGDPVNVAQRLEAMTVEKGVPIICSGATLGPYKQRYPHEPLGIVRVKGRTETVDVYALTTAGPRAAGPPPAGG
ncbi:MAG: adenylate/guanylate cyclase domain-containing protein [bacterium]|nr:adenylate/guanylate cyclase domain-containing protein [bacterium]